MNTKSLENIRVVAIDDASSILTFLRVSLEALGAIFHEAQTASYGMALCEQFQPDLVILDLGLPDKEGLNILPRIKRVEKKSTRPIVLVLTVRNEQKYKDMAQELGADAYMTKPFHIEDFLEVVHHKLGLPPNDGGALPFTVRQRQAS